jgi:hypothetical protein
MIAELCRAGIPATGANNDIQVGIGLLYEMVKTRRYKYFRGDNKYTVDEFSQYHYPSPEEDIKADKDLKDRTPVKQNDDTMDALRYVNTATYDGYHRKTPEIISHLEQKGQLSVYERAKRVFEPSTQNYEEW